MYGDAGSDGAGAVPGGGGNGTGVNGADGPPGSAGGGVIGIPAAPHVIAVAPRPSSSRGIGAGPPVAGRMIVMPTFVNPPPASRGLTSTLARPAASVVASVDAPPS